MYSMTKRLGTELDGGEGKVLRIVHEEWVKGTAIDLATGLSVRLGERSKLDECKFSQ